MTDTTPPAVAAMRKKLKNTFRNMDGPEASAMLAALADERDRYRELAACTHKANMATMGEADRLRGQIEAAEAEAAALRETLRDEIVMAYEQGALDVHNNWQDDRDPDFSEAASGYAASRLPLKENPDD